jgi:thiol-disulfide isomerase/thioredoxin
MIFCRYANLLFVFFLISSNLMAQEAIRNDNNQLVITFQNQCHIDMSFNYTKTITTGNYALVALYYEDEEDLIEYKKNKIPEKIKISMNDDYVVMRHYLNFMDFNDYIFRKGDSVLIEYEQNLPIITILNRKTAQNDFDAEDLFRKHIKLNDYSPVAKYLKVINLFAKKLFNDEKMMNDAKKMTKGQIQIRNSNAEISIKRELYPQCKYYLKRYNLFLDSLKTKGLISDVSYHFYSDKIENLSDLLVIENEQLSESEIQKIAHKHANNPYKYQEVYRRKLLRAIANKYIIANANYLDIEDGRNKDPRDVYAQINKSTLFIEKDKYFLMSREMNLIAQLLPRADFQSYFKLFEQDVKDSSMVNQMRDRYALEFDESRSEAKSLVLMGTAKEKQSFKQILEAHKGRVLYVDFWASWCAPCRAAMPQSAKLRQDLKDKNVVFVYLSIDKVFEQWKKANEKEGLEAYPNSFLITNAEVNEFIKQQKINSIPRYMIFDKQGKLAYPNAPNVESKELTEMLIKMANQ